MLTAVARVVMAVMRIMVGVEPVMLLAVGAVMRMVLIEVVMVMAARR